MSANNEKDHLHSCAPYKIVRGEGSEGVTAVWYKNTLAGLQFAASFSLTTLLVKSDI